ncbi:MAG: gamma-glutamyltransferase [Bryobacteraceae bacterium]
MSGRPLPSLTLRIPFAGPTSLLLLLLTGSFCAFAAQATYPQGRNYGRSVVYSRQGIVATLQTLASSAGADILRQGGSAVDAAIAANAALGVTEPMMNGVGGDLFAIVYEAKTGKLYGLNASGWSAKGLTIQYLKAKGITGNIPQDIYAVTVPGAVAGWAALHKRFGKLPLAQDLQPAIYYAQHGVPVTGLIDKVWQEKAALLRKNPAAAHTFLIDGQAPEPGQIFRDPDLAHSLRLIAAHGSDAFYKGPIGKAIVEFSKQQGGVLTEADFANFQPQWVTPLSTTYHGWTVYELPPNTQGIAALSMLNIMEQFPLKQYGHNSAKALHVMIEAKKLAYADLLKYVGDPRFSHIPINQLLSKNLARKRAALIDPNRAHCSVLPSKLSSKLNSRGHDTTYLSVIDRDGNIVSLIQSNYAAFGTGLVAPGTGFVLQNRGQLFSLKPGGPNSLAPHKRPLHTLIPAFMRKGNITIGFGIMGGFNQAQAHAQFVSNIVDFGMNIQAALSAPRFTKITFGGCDVSIESRVPEAVLQKLRAKGHQIEVVAPYSMKMGRGNAVMRKPNGVNAGASSPRGDGEAIPQVPDWNAH